MSEIDNLESLSNSDLRKKCLEHGLPNVPITDSSRNILIKKLRASLSGAPPTSSPKKSLRRETIHVSKVNPVVESKEETKVEPERRAPSRGGSRRTIAGTPTFETQKASETQVNVEKKASAQAVAPAPIGTRRRSTREQEIPPSQKEHRPLKGFDPVVILESDEEDSDLLLAAQQVEQKSRPPSALQNEMNVRSRSSRSVSLSKTGVVTTSYKNVKPIAEVPEIPTRNLVTENFSRDIYKPSINTSANRYSLNPSFSAGTNTLMTTGDLRPRYSTNTLGGGSYTSKATSVYNEQSDDNEEQQDYETPFLSSFARNLERLKTDVVPIGKSNVDLGADYASPRPMHRTKRYEITGRRPAHDSVTETFRKFLIALDRKYNLRLYLVLATVFVVLVFLYVVIYQ